MTGGVARRTRRVPATAALVAACGLAATNAAVAGAQVRGRGAPERMTAVQQGAKPVTAGASSAAVLPDSVVEARTTALAATLRCPVCQGLSLQDSPSELAQQMRRLIRDQVASGKSDADVRDYFLSKYGEFILLEPRPRGFNLLAYLLPAVLLVGGGVIVARNVHRWTRSADGAGPARSAPPDD